MFLPVPVSVSLPAVIDPGRRKKTRGIRKEYVLAACAVALLAGAVGVFSGDTDPVTDAATDTPPASRSASVPAPAKPETAQAPDYAKAEIDSVQFGNAGRAVVAGRAKPGADLVLLHGLRPLGTVRADDTGNWTFATRVPAQAEKHEISVAPLQIETTVTVDKPAFVPKPQRRPAPPPVPASGRSYFVQIASLPSPGDADREATKLVPRLAGIFPPERIAVRAATIEEGRTVYRVAVGGFTTPDSARSACDRIRSTNTPCLVMQEP